MVPAFTGIGAPYWREEATAAFLGMTRLTGQAELVRAALESIAYQIADLVRAAQSAEGSAGVLESEIVVTRGVLFVVGKLPPDVDAGEVPVTV